MSNTPEEPDENLDDLLSMTSIRSSEELREVNLTDSTLDSFHIIEGLLYVTDMYSEVVLIANPLLFLRSLPSRETNAPRHVINYTSITSDGNLTKARIEITRTQLIKLNVYLKEAVKQPIQLNFDQINNLGLLYGGVVLENYYNFLKYTDADVGMIVELYREGLGLYTNLSAQSSWEISGYSKEFQFRDLHSDILLIFDLASNLYFYSKRINLMHAVNASFEFTRDGRIYRCLFVLDDLDSDKFVNIVIVDGGQEVFDRYAGMAFPVNIGL